jgi:hypothetical protein
MFWLTTPAGRVPLRPRYGLPAYQVLLSLKKDVPEVRRRHRQRLGGRVPVVLVVPAEQEVHGLAGRDGLAEVLDRRGQQAAVLGDLGGVVAVRVERVVQARPR